MRIHPLDAAPRNIVDGDIVRLFNERGNCLAGVIISEDVRPGVVQLSTGAWYDPLDPADPQSLCVHGNPNVLTRDVGTSKLAQGCCGQLTTVQVELFRGNLPPVQAHEPPVAVETAAEAAEPVPPEPAAELYLVSPGDTLGAIVTRRFGDKITGDNDEGKAQLMERMLWDEGVYALSIVFPTVGRGKARIRTMPNTSPFRRSNRGCICWRGW